jgi:cytochrome c oxidase cbb3-type subunit 3
VQALRPFALLVLLVLVGLGVHAIQRRHLEERILSTWPESAARDPDLSRFAAALAEPALRSHCAGCHGTDLRGDPKRGVPALIDKEWLYGEGGVVDIETTIGHGIRSGDHRGRDLADMPGFILQNPYRRYQVASLQPAEIHDLVAFILRLNGRDADPEAAARGEAVYSSAMCYDCHTASAQGDPAIGAPSLRSHAWLYGDSAAAITDVIAYGRSGICPSWAGRLPPATIRAIAIYLQQRSGTLR